MRRSRGYILPMALSLIAMAAIVLAQVCRQTMRQSLAASQDARELQVRWGMRSCQATFLPQAEAILAAGEKAAHQPLPSVQTQVQLGGCRFELLVADETAKANLNTLYRRHDLTAVEEAARSAARSSNSSVQVRLRPMNRDLSPALGEKLPPAFGSFGQVFDEAAVASPLAIRSAAGDLTCWGGGKLNWRRASAAALEQVLHGNRQAADRIVSLRQAAASGTPLTLAAALQLAPELKKTANLWFTEKSDAQSLWITCGDPSHPAAWLAVRETHSNGRSQVTNFSWQP